MTTANTSVETPAGFKILRLATCTPSMRPVLAKRIDKIEKKVFSASECFDYNTELKKKNIGLLLAHRDGDSDDVVAYLVYQRVKRLVWLHKLCVIEKERGQGLAKTLLRAFKEDMSRGGCEGIHLWVNETNDPARSLYESCGFRAIDTRPDYYGPSQAGLKLELALARYS